MDLSIIIPFVNEKEEVSLTIESIEKHKGNVNYEIIVINDASDDGFDYCYHLCKKQNVRYYENSQRIGVAACRDIGVMLSVYDKFLLLDAHMRLYDDNTLVAFIETLSNNEKSVICCRTIGIGNNHRSTTPFAAYIEFWGGHGGLYADWNLYDPCPKSSISPVPCILGAAYAACKKYWIYLGGLSGLASYGSDEAYISIKVWLNGGKCLLLKNIIIGHLYRKTPPYTIKHIDYVYNKVFISLLLLPSKTCFNVLENLSHNFRIQFNYSMNMIYNRLSEFFFLKEYYDKILTDPFDVFFDFNNKCALKSGVEINTIAKKNISIDVISNAISKIDKMNDYGLYNGKMGLVIVLYMQGLTSKAELILENIIESIENSNKVILAFDNGLLGIAWGISFLIENKMINGDINELLYDFDDVIFNRFDIKDYGDWSFEKGLLGLTYYSIMRLYQNENLLKKYPVFFQLLHKIIEERHLNNCNLIETNFPLVILLFLSFYNQKCKLIDNIVSINALLCISNIANSHDDSLFYKGLISSTSCKETDVN